MTKLLSIDRAQGGSLTAASPNKGVAVADYDLACVRAVSAPLLAQTVAGVIRWVIGTLGSPADRRTYVHVYVTQGDSDLVRGTLLSDFVDTYAWGSTSPSPTPQTTTPVVALAGDRLVVELGARSTGSASGGITSVYYGGNDGVFDQYLAGSSSSWASWVEFDPACCSSLPTPAFHKS